MASNISTPTTVDFATTLELLIGSFNFLELGDNSHKVKKPSCIVSLTTLEPIAVASYVQGALMAQSAILKTTVQETFSPSQPKVASISLRDSPEEQSCGTLQSVDAGNQMSDGRFQTVQQPHSVQGTGIKVKTSTGSLKASNGTLPHLSHLHTTTTLTKACSQLHLACSSLFHAITTHLSAYGYQNISSNEIPTHKYVFPPKNFTNPSSKTHTEEHNPLKSSPNKLHSLIFFLFLPETKKKRCLPHSLAFTLYTFSPTVAPHSPQTSTLNSPVLKSESQEEDKGNTAVRGGAGFSGSGARMAVSRYNDQRNIAVIAGLLAVANRTVGKQPHRVEMETEDNLGLTLSKPMSALNSLSLFFFLGQAQAE